MSCKPYCYRTVPRYMTCPQPVLPQKDPTIAMKKEKIKSKQCGRLTLPTETVSSSQESHIATVSILENLTLVFNLLEARIKFGFTEWFLACHEASIDALEEVTSRH